MCNSINKNENKQIMWHEYFIFYDLHNNRDRNSNLSYLLMGDTIHPQQQKNPSLKNTKQNLTKIVQKKTYITQK
jgi:hypothetical protein